MDDELYIDSLNESGNMRILEERDYHVPTAFILENGTYRFSGGEWWYRPPSKQCTGTPHWERSSYPAELFGGSEARAEACGAVLNAQAIRRRGGMPVDSPDTTVRRRGLSNAMKFVSAANEGHIESWMLTKFGTSCIAELSAEDVRTAYLFVEQVAIIDEKLGSTREAKH